MMQHLLAERFQLRLHREARDLPVYALVVGKNGAKLKISDPDAREGAVVRGTADGLHMETKKGSMEALARQLSLQCRSTCYRQDGIDWNLPIHTRLVSSDQDSRAGIGCPLAFHCGPGTTRLAA
jgi:uncharacterized protein (TIGR03435 family)